MSNVFVNNRAIYVGNVVPIDLCQETINGINEREFKLCSFNTDINLEIRNSFEVKISNKEITQKFWKHISHYVPLSYDNFQLIGPDYNRVYLLKYNEGQFFKKHYDGYSQDSFGNRSMITVMVYLNNVEEGGETRFYSEPNRNVVFPGGCEVFDVKPQTGTMVAFDHKILHEGLPIIKGNKYCIRFNILYKNVIQEKISEKYKPTSMISSSGEIILTADKRNEASKNRWIEVSLRPHVFNIKKGFPGFVDTTMGRPPTWEEDYCPNCYEILSLEKNYQNCPGCNSVVESINNEQRIKNYEMKKELTK